MSTVPICQKCLLKPCHPDGNGGYYSFCRKNCTGGVTLTTSPLKSPNVPICKECGKKPCAVNPNGGFYDKCLRSCKQTKQIPICKNCKQAICASNGKGGFFDKCKKSCALHCSTPNCDEVCAFDNTNNVYFTKCKKSCLAPICLAGCGNYCAKDKESGDYYSVCGRKCAKKFRGRCDYPMTIPMRLSESEAKYQEVKTEFVSQWKGDGTVIVKDIIRLNLDDTKFREYQALAAINMKGTKLDLNCGLGNTITTFYSVPQTCTFGQHEQMDHCDEETCHVCQICQNGVHEFTEKFTRFGTTVTTTRLSSRAFGFLEMGKQKGIMIKTPIQTMFVCKVVAGRVLKLGKPDTTMTLDALNRSGYDSVVRIETPEDLYTHDDDAILPNYLIRFELYN